MRRNEDFISAFLSYTDNSESSETIRHWSAIACVAAALERRAFMRWGHTTIFPNLYTIIIAPSGARKGEPMMVARDLLKHCGVKLAPERITDEALIKMIAESMDSYQDENRVRFQCAVSILGEELSVLLRNKDIGFMADLTALYDCRDDWTYQTKGSGTDEIRGVCLNLLVSSAPDWLSSILPIEAVGGGFTSRCFFIVEESRGKIIPDPNLAMPDKKERERLIYDLEKIHSIVGEFTFDKGAYDFYIDWYVTEEERQDSNQFHIKDPKLSGYISRRATHIKKLSMAYCASRGETMRISEADIKRALETMLIAEKNMSNAFRALGRSPHAAVLDQVLTILRTEGSIEKPALMRMVQRDLDFADFGRIEVALDSMDYIDRRLRPGKPTIYIYKG